MRWTTWWQVLFALTAQSLAQGIVPTICEEEYCRCDSFTRVICNCSDNTDAEITLRPDGAYRVPSTASAIIIHRCHRVHFLSDTVRDLIHLRNVEIQDCNHVVINERALAWSPFPREPDMNPGLRISINNSTVNEIASHAIQGRVDDIIIMRNRIDNLKPFAFSNLVGVKNVELINNAFDTIGIQPFKKFSTLNFVMRDGVVGTLPSRFLSNVDVIELFHIEYVQIQNINSLTFLVNSPKRVLIESNVIGTLEADGFHIVTRGPITFRNNTVQTLARGAFLGFTADTEVASVMGRQELLIDNNTLSELVPSALMYNSTTLTMRIGDLNLNKSCSCELVEEWRDVMYEPSGIITCWYSLENQYTSLRLYSDSRCGEFKQTFWIYVVIGIVVVAIISVVVIIFIVRHENKKKKNKMQIVLPDGKTYRETEVHIVVERAELLSTDF
ncbi:uncharacterized protein LOC131853081 [Achroia grisella]|uniref:uncharacterized protein LOC131853081 n=1 Tax=Achroia grisella TaxID=688607 RepID=UPI0027D313CD|nr:uncharacterized protein LOC131853081 [Achroia grisella]XP_059059875.1 uncharacterized protein LOC131853081 [Achroia grisella]